MKKSNVKVKAPKTSVKPGDVIEFELNGILTRDEITYVGIKCIEGVLYDLTKLILAGNYKKV